MTYCSRCGNKNEDVAQFCSKCGSPLHGPHRGKKKGHDDQCENQCEEECSGGPGGGSWFWGLIVIVVGLWIIFELGLKNLSGMPTWVNDLQIWWIIPLLVGAAIMIAGIRMLTKKPRHRR